MYKLIVTDNITEYFFTDGTSAISPADKLAASLSGGKKETHSSIIFQITCPRKSDCMKAWAKHEEETGFIAIGQIDFLLQ